MKTNQNLIRSESFIQRTKDGYFHAKHLENIWNLNHPEKRKLLGEFKRISSTMEYVEQLQKEGVEEPIKVGNKGTWMHPKLFIDFAMWLSVEFKSIVIDYILDGLIQSRNDAGDYFNEMRATILETYVNYYNRKPSPLIYATEASYIKVLAGVKKDRNELTEKELNIITGLQKMNTVLLKRGTGITSRKKMLSIYAQGLKL